MTAPAGPCEWCGGPQNWTFILGEMYVRCQSGCLGLFDEGPVLPRPTGELTHVSEVLADVMEHVAGTVVVPLEGGAGKETDLRSKRELDPPAHFLMSLWEGFDG